MSFSARIRFKVQFQGSQCNVEFESYGDIVLWIQEARALFVNLFDFGEPFITLLSFGESISRKIVYKK